MLNAHPNNSLWRRMVRLVVGITLLGILISQVDVGEVGQTLLSARPAYILLAVALIFLCNLLSAWQWFVLLKAPTPSRWFSLARWRKPGRADLQEGGEGSEVSVWQLFVLYLIGKFFNYFLPTSIGGDIIRTYELTRIYPQVELALASVVMTRVTGFFGLLLTLAISSTFYPKAGGIVDILKSVLLAGCAVAIVGSAIIFSVAPLKITAFLGTGLSQRVNGFLMAIQTYRRHQVALLTGTLLAVLFQVATAFVYYSILLALNLHISIVYLLVFIPLVGLVAMVPLSLNGLGLREGSLVMLLSKAGIAAADGLSVALLALTISVGNALLGGLFYTALPRQEKKA
jgi:uncharacterized protein (TIRG00374 family)